MYTNRLLGLLLVALSMLSIAQALQVDGHQAVRRQRSGEADDESSSVGPSRTTSSPSASKTSTTPTSAESTPTSNTDVSTTPPPSSSTTPPPTTSKSTEQTSKSTSTSDKDTSSSDKSTSTKTTPPVVSSTITKIITTTNADGSPTEITTASTSVSTPGLAQDGSGNQTSGMAPSTKKTIIGVVVGVGGAIVLGVIGLVAWRIWGRKKPVEEPDNLVGTGYAPIEKSDNGGSVSGRSPFQSTLESYHAPTQVNASSNF